jgi:hypothetical protein
MIYLVIAFIVCLGLMLLLMITQLLRIENTVMNMADKVESEVTRNIM